MLLGHGYFILCKHVKANRQMAFEIETFHQEVRFGIGSSCAVLPKVPVVPQP